MLNNPFLPSNLQAENWNLFSQTSSLKISPMKPKRKARYQNKERDENRPKRKKCPAKEKERNQAINDGYDRLQSTIKFINKSSKIPKVKVLKVAIRYIEYLQRKLQTPDNLFDPSTDDFALQAMEVIQTKNCYTKRAAEELGSTTSNVSSPQQQDAGYLSHSGSTPNSSYSSDYYDTPLSHQPSSNFETMPPPRNHQQFYPFTQMPSYIPQTMDYENYHWNHKY